MFSHTCARRTYYGEIFTEDKSIEQ